MAEVAIDPSEVEFVPLPEDKDGFDVKSGFSVEPFYLRIQKGTAYAQLNEEYTKRLDEGKQMMSIHFPGEDAITDEPREDISANAGDGWVVDGDPDEAAARIKHLKKNDVVQGTSAYGSIIGRVIKTDSVYREWLRQNGNRRDPREVTELWEGVYLVGPEVVLNIGTKEKRLRATLMQWMGPADMDVSDLPDAATRAAELARIQFPKEFQKGGYWEEEGAGETAPAKQEEEKKQESAKTPPSTKPPATTAPPKTAPPKPAAAATGKKDANEPPQDILDKLVELAEQHEDPKKWAKAAVALEGIEDTDYVNWLISETPKKFQRFKLEAATR